MCVQIVLDKFMKPLELLSCELIATNDSSVQMCVQRVLDKLYEAFEVVVL